MNRIVRHLRPLRRLALGLCIAGAASFAAAQGAAPASFNVGATATGVPFTFLDVKSNSIQGMMVDTVTAVGKAGGFTVNVQQTVFSALMDEELTFSSLFQMGVDFRHNPPRHDQLIWFGGSR